MNVRIVTFALALIAVICFGWGYVAATHGVFPDEWIRSVSDHFSASSVQPPADPSAHTAIWKEKASFFTTLGAHADVVMIGDSITDGAEWGEMFPGIHVANRGIDGDTTDGVLQRMDGILSVQARKAFIMIGINDFAVSGRSVDAAFDDYRRIIEILEKSGARVFIQSTLLCNEATATWISCVDNNDKIRKLNARLRGLASPGVTYIDINAGLSDKGGLKVGVTYDGVHLNGAGYRIWKDEIGPFLRQD